MTHEIIIRLIMQELSEAKEKHPKWPEDIIHAVGIMVEEAGESIQAALDYIYLDVSKEQVIKEIIQTGAMVFRVLENMNIYEDKE